MQTTFDFTLPRGYPAPDGRLIRDGRMRLATALDEVATLQDPRVLQNEAYAPVLLLSRVVTALGELESITPQVIEGLFASDFSYLEDLYERLNSPEHVVLGAVCPHCSTAFQLQVSPLGV